MRISDWSSDVCSSDLAARSASSATTRKPGCAPRSMHARNAGAPNEIRPTIGDANEVTFCYPAYRSAERRVGKECVSTCRSRWSPHHYKKNNITLSAIKLEPRSHTQHTVINLTP